MLTLSRHQQQRTIAQQGMQYLNEVTCYTVINSYKRRGIVIVLLPAVLLAPLLLPLPAPVSSIS